MSFKITLMVNNSPENKLDKELAVVREVTGTLRSGTSILDPVIVIQDSIPAEVIGSSNYAVIDEFSRNYFITDIRTTVNGLWQISFHVDVLTTYKHQILTQSGIVNRSENRFNMYLDDGWFVDYQNPAIVVKRFPNATAFEHQEYVLVLAGNTGAVNNTTSEVTDNGSTE